MTPFLPTSPFLDPARSHLRSLACLAALMLAAAFLIRWPRFGDPALMIDEQFYLLVGDRMLHGALPFVDIWDRKPIGLFLIYAACRLLGGQGFVQYQVVATLFAAGTACIIAGIARRATRWPAAAMAGLLYLLWLEVAEGSGGQSPIFYNLPLAGAAALVIGAIETTDRGGFRVRAFAAMLLTGIALQIKYTVLAEGLFFGLVLAAQLLRRASSSWRALGEAALLACTALLPTAAAYAGYAVAGHGRAFWFANFVSIMLRQPTDAADLGYRGLQALLRLVPFGTCVLASAWLLRQDPRPAMRRWQLFMAGWLAAALLGFCSVGVLYSHYLLPMFVPCAIAAAPIFARRPLGWVMAALMIWLPASHLHYPDVAIVPRHRREIGRITALIPRTVSHTCLQMFDGPPILYYTSNACMLSRFVFPDHLSAAIEASAIGVDPRAELRRILSLRPGAITIGRTDIRTPNAATFAIMRSALQRNYRLAGAAPFDGREIEVWVPR